MLISARRSGIDQVIRVRGLTIYFNMKRTAALIAANLAPPNREILIEHRKN